MDKLNYVKHDWNENETITEANMDHMEDGVKKASDKANEIIDNLYNNTSLLEETQNRLELNEEEISQARGEYDSISERIHRDNEAMFDIVNEGSYLEFNGKDITVDHAKNGYTKGTILKGQTYQNLATNNFTFSSPYNNKFNISNASNSITISKKEDYTEGWRVISAPVDLNLIKNDTDYTIIFNFTSSQPAQAPEIGVMKGDTTQKILSVDKITSLNQGLNKMVIHSNLSNVIVKEQSFYLGIFDSCMLNINDSVTVSNLIILEGDWTNKEVPSEITGIESVGEKEGNKISILSHNKNLFDSAFEIGTISADNGNNSDFTSRARTGFIKLKENCLNLNVFNNFMINRIFYYDINKKYLSNKLFNSSNIIIDNSNAKYFRIAIMDATNNNRNLTQSDILLANKSVVFSSSNVENYIEPKEDKKEISLPIEGGLKSLPNGVADTIEQREDGVYSVQNIGKWFYDSSTVLSWTIEDKNENWKFGRYIDNKRGNTSIICDTFKMTVDETLANGAGVKIYTHSNTNQCELRFTIPKTVLIANNGTITEEEINNWFRNNPTTLYYQLNIPVETKLDIDTVNLQVFKDKTYILSENNIKPEIICKAPVDVNQTIADLQEEQEQLIETYNTLKAQNEELSQSIENLENNSYNQTANMLDLDMRIMSLEENKDVE